MLVNYSSSGLTFSKHVIYLCVSDAGALYSAIKVDNINGLTAKGTYGVFKPALAPRMDTGPYEYNWTLTSGNTGKSYTLFFDFTSRTNASCSQMYMEVIGSDNFYKMVCPPSSSGDIHRVHITTLHFQQTNVVIRHKLNATGVFTLPNFTVHYVGEYYSKNDAME